jgi:hypothetical protein
MDLHFLIYCIFLFLITFDNTVVSVCRVKAKDNILRRNEHLQIACEEGCEKRTECSCLW